MPATLLQTMQPPLQRKYPDYEQARLQIGRWNVVRDVWQSLPRQHFRRDVKFWEILHCASSDPDIAAPLVVITMLRTYKLKKES